MIVNKAINWLIIKYIKGGHFMQRNENIVTYLAWCYSNCYCDAAYINSLCPSMLSESQRDSILAIPRNCDV